MRRRLVEELIRRKIAGDETAARALLDTGRVMVSGYPATNPDRMVADNEPIVMTEGRLVSRAANKLRGAIQELQVEVAGLKCLDVGAGHGGFTKVLLEEGAASVTTVDVGYGILDAMISKDPRVAVHERTNFRHVDPSALGAPFDLVVADVSFISLTVLAGNIAKCTGPKGLALLMVKPQFEAPSKDVGHGGVVQDSDVWKRAMLDVASAFEMRGLHLTAARPSRLKGAKGNQEFFLLFERERGSVPPKDLVMTAAEEAMD